MDKHFAAYELRLLDDTEEIEIETVRSDTKEAQRAVVWVVVVDCEAYVRSVNGAQGHWFQQLAANPRGAIYAEDQQMPIRAVPVSDSDIQLKVSEAYARKYAFYPQDVAWMVGPEVLSTTLRLEPRPPGASE